MTFRHDPDEHPKADHIYALTGGPGDDCLSNGNSFADSIVRCSRCRSPLTNADILVGRLCTGCRRRESA